MSRKKAQLLGMSWGSAGNRLRKSILFDLLQWFDLDWCYRCDKQIDNIDDLSIEHKEPWQSSADPKAAFFDLDNIAFSHLRCNRGAERRASACCSNGHPWTPENTITRPDGTRRCRQCQYAAHNRWRQKQ